MQGDRLWDEYEALVQPHVEALPLVSRGRRGGVGAWMEVAR